MWLRIAVGLPRIRPMSTARRAIAIVLALIGAAAFAIAVQGHRWWVIGDDVGIGTIATESCFGDCRVGTLAWTGGSGTWQRAGFATYAGGLCAALALVALAGALAAKRTGRLVAAVAVVATLTAAGAGVAFHTLAPELTGASLGRGAIAFVIAIVAALAAAAVTVTARPAPVPAPGVN